MLTLDKQRKKELASAYKQSFRPMGVYQIRNVENGKIFVDSSFDLVGTRNRLDFLKQMDMNTITELKQDWKTYGADCFMFEELDRIKQQEDEVFDEFEQKKYQEEVAVLLDMWLEKLQPYADKGYNKPKRIN